MTGVIEAVLWHSGAGITVTAERPEAFERSEMTYVITEPCIGTKGQSCVEVCPVDCIYDGEDQSA